MTPIDHCATGIAAGGIVAPLLNKAFKIPYRALVPIYFISSILPDIDGLSLLVSKAAYFGKQWYSHHMAAHSFLGAAFFSALIALVYIVIAISSRGVINLFRRDKIPLEYRIRRTIGAFIAAFIGYAVHFAGDIPTPPGPWGGIALLWPDPKMYGGWSRINWHNWYLIYISIIFLMVYFAVHFTAGFFFAFKFKVTRWISYFFRAVSVACSIFFLFEMYTFVEKHDFKKMGYSAWDKLNRQLVPAEYMKNADEYYHKATIFWRKNLFSMADAVKTGNRALHFFEELHGAVAPKIGAMIPQMRSAQDDMRLYRALQVMAPGMEDSRAGDYRVWFFRDSLPRLDYYNRGFLYFLVHKTKKNIMQITNSWMIVFHILERDSRGNAARVKKIYHNDKIFVSDNIKPQLNLDKLPLVTFKFWEHDRVQYSLIPGSGHTRFGNLAKGYYPTISKTPGVLWKGWRSGVLIHDGPWSEGCIVAAYIHTDIGRQLEYPFYKLWARADEIIKKDIPGSIYRGKNIYWGRMMFIKDPQRIYQKNSQTEKTFAADKYSSL